MTLDEMIMRAIAIIALGVAISGWERAKSVERRLERLSEGFQKQESRLVALEIKAIRAGENR
jgi:hypothetical protein